MNIDSLIKDNISLRKIVLKDAEYMLEWMHTPSISSCFQNDFIHYNIDNVIDFINKNDEEKSIHRAIIGESDEYLGTVSLKNIDGVNQNAEYAIVLRSKAIGRGIALQATDLILNIAFNEKQLNKVYLNVLDENKRAVALYEKYGFKFEGKFSKHIFQNNEFKDLLWYSILRSDYLTKHL